jgi:2,5-diketo-D-gluconate reductase B
MGTETQPIVEVQGVAVPALGFGTWQLTGRAAEEGVRDALEIGYRHIDTARMYGNEREVGRAIAAAGVPREELWLTTKVWTSDAAADRVVDAGEDSLRALGVDSIDLLLLHWPNRRVPLAETIEGFNRLQDAGVIRHFGLSNHSARMIEEALRYGPVFCDQVEYHPLARQDALLELAAERDLLITAYSPLARGRVLRDPTLRRIAEAHGVSPAAVALRWLLDQPRVSPIPKATTHERRVENWRDVLALELSDGESAEIDAIA